MMKKDTKKQRLSRTEPVKTPQPPVAAKSDTTASAGTARKTTPDALKRRGAGGKRAASAKAKAAPPRAPRPSGLDVAAKVLATTREPMRCGDLVNHMLDKGLWKTAGK